MNDTTTALHILCPHCATTNRVPRTRLSESPQCGRCKKALFEGRPVVLDSRNFDAHLRGDLPVLVDFWAAWCGPCAMMAPHFERAAAQLEPQMRLGKLDTEAAQDIAARYGIPSIPTLVVFKNGQERGRQSGAADAASIVQFARNALRSA